MKVPAADEQGICVDISRQPGKRGALPDLGAALSALDIAVAHGDGPSGPLENLWSAVR